MYHVLNRANARRTIFETHADFLAFEDILAEVQGRLPMRIFAWCVMPNHWHLVLWPREDGDLSRFMRLVTLIHTRWHGHRKTAGTGHLYQGRFKSFAVQSDAHFLTVCRYVEANALRAGLVRRAEDWRWSSLPRTLRGCNDAPQIEPWRSPRPAAWLRQVNEASPAKELERLRSLLDPLLSSLGRPYRRRRTRAPCGHQSSARLHADRLRLDRMLRQHRDRLCGYAAGGRTARRLDGCRRR